MPECTKCGTELEFDKTVYYWGDEEEIEILNSGHCPKCGKKFKWKDVYKYLYFKDLEEE